MVRWGPKKTPAQNPNCKKFEKDLNENILSCKRENHTEAPGGGMWRIERFGNKLLKPDIRTTDKNPLANNRNG